MSSQEALTDKASQAYQNYPEWSSVSDNVKFVIVKELGELPGYANNIPRYLSWSHDDFNYHKQLLTKLEAELAAEEQRILALSQRQLQHIMSTSDVSEDAFAYSYEEDLYNAEPSHVNSPISRQNVEHALVYLESVGLRKVLEEKLWEHMGS
jgi:hypothetical protein